MAGMASNLVKRRTHGVQIDQLARLHNRSIPPPLEDRTILGSLKNFCTSMWRKVLSAPRTDDAPCLPVSPGITTVDNNFYWSVWKSIFTISSGCLITCFAYAPFVFFIRPFPIYTTASIPGFIILFFSGLAIYRSLSIVTTTVCYCNSWMSLLRLDFNIVLRLIKQLIINVLYTFGFQHFAILAVYASSFFSASSVAVCKMSTNRYSFSITLIDDFMSVLFHPFYDRLVTQHKYLDAIIYSCPIILAVVARLTDPIFPPVRSHLEEIEMVMAQQFGLRHRNIPPVTTAQERMDIVTREPIYLDPAQAAALFEEAKKRIRDSISDKGSSSSSAALKDLEKNI